MPDTVAAFVTVTAVRRVLLPALLAVVGSLYLYPVAAHAHGEDGEGYSWEDDPKNSKIFDDCRTVFANDVSSYRVDYRLPVDVSTSASRVEVVSQDAVVNYLVVAATNWVFHREQPDSVAHAERRAPGVPPRGLLLRMGFERKDAQVGPVVTFQVKVFSDTGASPDVLELAAPPFEGASSGSREFLTNFICREELAAAPSPSEDATAVTIGIPSDASEEVSGPRNAGSGGFPVLLAAGVGSTILIASALLLVWRRRRL